MSATGIAFAGPRCSPSEMPAPSAIRRIALKAATVNDDISERKKFIAPVTVPICALATEFCSETTLTGNVVPKPEREQRQHDQQAPQRQRRHRQHRTEDCR